MSTSDIIYMPAVEIASAIREKILSPVQIVDAILNRIDRLNPKLNAYCTLLAEDARKQAKEAEDLVMKGGDLGLLHGVPVSVKDLIFTKGIRTTFGSRIYENFLPDADDVVVERLRALLEDIPDDVRWCLGDYCSFGDCPFSNVQSKPCPFYEQD